LAGKLVLFTTRTGKTVTQELSDEFDAADETLSEILDGLVVQFQATNAKLGPHAALLRNALFAQNVQGRGLPQASRIYQDARTIVDASASHASPNQPTPAPTPAAPTGLKTNP
jgi:hypothetical protein